ncbi:hypothetical protein CRBSH125_26820 [Afipia carboxidovorans]|nr:hypothetical protein CRBSH125_26820 [Afipia carboxidovorans]
MTVFQSDGGWKYCIADPSDRADPCFSNPYDTEEEAKHEALALIKGAGSQFSTKREKRNHSLREEASDLTAVESERLNKLRQSLTKAFATPNPKRSTLEKIRDNVRKRASQSDHLESQLIGAHADDVFLDQIAVIKQRYWEIKWQLDELLDGTPSKPESDNLRDDE